MSAAAAPSRIREVIDESTASNAASMVQIRNMPESMHRVLKAKAAMAGLSLSDYLIQQLSETTMKPTIQEWVAEVNQQMAGRQRVKTVNAADIVREMRGE
jgi:antitoxin FitA